MGLDQDQRAEVTDIAQLEVRRYFDHYLNTVLPEQSKRAREHTHLMIEQHNASKAAHGSVEMRVQRFLWTLVGVSLASGAGGAGIAKLLNLL